MTANVTTKFNVWNELARASAHAAAQGGFAVVQGGNFWQGAAAGFVGSLAGSFSQGAGLQGWGMVGVSTAMGGVGVAIAGGKAEDILFGMVSGAMVGVLNHMQGEKEERKVNIAMRDKKDLITTPHLEVDVHSTITQDNQNSNITIVKDAESNNLVEVQMPGYSLNTDGSLTVGPSFFQVGSDFRNYVFEFICSRRNNN